MTVLDLTTALVVGGLFAAGFFLLLQRTLMRLLFGFLILGHATNLLLLAAAGPAGAPPITGEVRAGSEADADPLPQAMALTAIVITFALTIFLLALVHRAWQLHGHDEVRDDAEDRRIAENQEREHTDADTADREQRPAASSDPTSRSLSMREEPRSEAEQ
ncbi:Na(+)/H(+) antiporter subunit C, partial [Streptomyces sp. P38-E01]